MLRVAAGERPGRRRAEGRSCGGPAVPRRLVRARRHVARLPSRRPAGRVCRAAPRPRRRRAARRRHVRPGALREFWLDPYFPSIQDIDRARFPNADGARATQLATVRASPASRFLPAFTARGHHARSRRSSGSSNVTSRRSTCSSRTSFARGTQLALDQLPPTVEYPIEWLIAVARALAASRGHGRAVRRRRRRGGARRAGEREREALLRAGRAGSSRSSGSRSRGTRRRGDPGRWGRRSSAGRGSTSATSTPTASTRSAIDTYTGGAHCCFQTRFFRWLPARKAYGMTFRNWLDAGYRPSTSTARAPSSCSAATRDSATCSRRSRRPRSPIQIWEFDGGRLRDVTRLFPGQVELDAKRLWRIYLEHRRNEDVRGVLAAWQADQYLLGREDAGWLELERALSAATSRGRTASGRRGGATCERSARSSSRRATPSADARDRPPSSACATLHRGTYPFNPVP